jgi:uncharacterized Tic20 family protein
VSEQPVPTCPNCGANTPSGATFCPNCGHSLVGGAPPPPPGTPFSATPLSPADARTWAIGAHVSAIGTALLGGISSFIGPLVVWLIRKDSDPFVAAHALEALNFNITVDVLVLAGLLLGALTLGLGFILIGPILLIVGVLWLIWTIQAATAASNGQPYRYPFSIRLVS